MTTGNLRLAQWLPRDLPVAGDTVAVTQPDPLETEFTTAAFPEAPIDGKQYGRQNEGWSIVPPLPFANDAPSDGNRYGRRNGAWSVVPNPEPDAPADGKDYARRNNAWQNLDSYATDAEVVAYVTANAIPEAPQDGKQYARQNRAWSLASTVFEAPADGKQYARKDSAWAVVQAANAITVDDVAPLTPKFGDRWVRPANGQDATWVPITGGGGTWVDTDTALMMLDPVPIASGGTGATTVAQARINLGINNPGGQVIFGDGTMPVPGLAWVNESSSGWYRPGANQRSYAMAGAGIEAVNAVDPLWTNSFLFPRQAGGNTRFYLDNAPPGAANHTQLVLVQNADGSSIVQNNAVGSGAAGAIYYQSREHAFGPAAAADVHATVSVKARATGNAALVLDKGTGPNANYIIARRGGLERWAMALGDGTAESGGNVGSNFTLNRYADNGAGLETAFSIDRNTGTGWFAQNFNGMATITANRGFYAPSNNDWVIRNTSYTVSGSHRVVYFQTASQIGDTLEFMGFHQPSVETFWRMQVGGGGNYFDFRNNGVGYASASWQAGSDGRIKTNREVIADAVAKVKAITGYVYDKLTATGDSMREAGVVAQDVEGVLPEAVSIIDTASTAPEGAQNVYTDFRALNYSAVTALLVNAIKEIDTRLAALEAA